MDRILRSSSRLISATGSDAPVQVNAHTSTIDYHVNSHMRIAHVFISMPVGGAEDLVLSIVRGTPQAQAVCLKELGVAGESAAADGLAVTLLPILKGKRFSPTAVWRLSRWLRDQHIDIVHTQVYNAHVYGVLAAWLAGIASVMHHQKTFNRERRRRTLTMRLLSRLAACQITLSNQTKQDVMNALALPERKTAVLPNFVDASVFTPAQDRAALRASLGLPVDSPIIGGIASLNTQKNHSATVRMMSALLKKLPQARGLIFGEGPLRRELQKQIDELGIAPQLTLAGNKRPILPWLQSLDLAVLPSTWEGQPMAILQALACGVPVICSRIEGNTAVLGSDAPGIFDLQNESEYADNVYAFFTDASYRRAVLEHQRRVQTTQGENTDFFKRLHGIYQQSRVC
jgi:glycosyltransferase involved in cell wall biosynthesis